MPAASSPNESEFPAPGSPQDLQLAARLVIDGVIPEQTMRAVLAKQKELTERGKPLSIGAICTRKQWMTGSEVLWMSSPEAPPAGLLPGMTLQGQLGQGGMSRVYQALDHASQRSVAVKILLPALSRKPKVVAEFKAECELMISLDHPNIVDGYALGEHDGLIYLVLEHIEGDSLLELLDQHGRFEEDAALFITLQTAKALTHLHERGFVHRDVKPANILLDGANTVKLCDMGLAIQAGEGGGETTAGTAQYIAPEQAMAEGGLDVRSDIYALGVTLYQTVVGKLPFDGETSHEAMVARMLDELRSPELKAMGISPHLHYFIQKMMALEREVRYQSPAELIEDIEEQIEGKKTLRSQPGRSKATAGELAKPFQEDRSRVIVKKGAQKPAPKPGRGTWPPPRRRPGR